MSAPVKCGAAASEVLHSQPGPACAVPSFASPLFTRRGGSPGWFVSGRATFRARLVPFRPTFVQSPPAQDASTRPAKSEDSVMLGCARVYLPLLALLLASQTAAGQDSALDERPRLFVPKRPPTPQEINRREALKKYV